MKGGLAGSVAMAVLAMLYGIVDRPRHLVPDQPAGRGFFPAPIRPRRNSPRFTGPLIIASMIHLRHVAAGRAALRRDAADVSAPPDSAWAA